MSFQMTMLHKLRHPRLIEIALLFLVSAVTYLPNLVRATIYRDDWYYTLDRLIGGPGVFQQMFSIDRPIRGPFFEIYYQLFGIQPLPYHLASYVWRLLGGLAALWLFHLLWPRQQRAGLVLALLFIVFPGYTRWMEGFEDQPRIFSSFLEVLSIVLTLKAIRAGGRLSRTAAWLGSILTGWAYIALVDFSIGMEVFRFLCVFVLVSHEQVQLSFLKKSVRALQSWAIAAVIPAGFLFWRLLLFHDTRKATDLGLQLSALTGSPLVTGATWLIRLFQSAANVAFLSWGASTLQSFFGLRLSDVAFGLLIAAVSVAGLWLADHLLASGIDQEDQIATEAAPSSWQMEAIAMGLIGIFAGVLPVIVANRYVNFTVYSHYALPASLAGVTLLGGLIHTISSRRVRLGVVSVLVLFAVLTHVSISAQILNEENTIGQFWQQVAWRAPGIRPGTTLFVNYPGVDYQGNIDAVQGPANFIYYATKTNQIPVTYPLYALPEQSDTIQSILTGGKKGDGYRTHGGAINYDNVLVISQPSASACVHLIDQHWPLFSVDDSEQILLTGPRSNIQNVVTGQASSKPAEFIFGPEPAHQWCYYFEKAEMALQTADWGAMAALGDEARQKGFRPADTAEWIPFLQAYAMLDRAKDVQLLWGSVQKEPFLAREACGDFKNMALPAGTGTLINKSMCPKPAP